MPGNSGLADTCSSYCSRPRAWRWGSLTSALSRAVSQAMPEPREPIVKPPIAQLCQRELSVEELSDIVIIIDDL